MPSGSLEVSVNVVCNSALDALNSATGGRLATTVTVRLAVPSLPDPSKTL